MPISNFFAKFLQRLSPEAPRNPWRRMLPSNQAGKNCSPYQPDRAWPGQFVLLYAREESAASPLPARC
jgi:hypothetical protein